MRIKTQPNKSSSAHLVYSTLLCTFFVTPLSPTFAPWQPWSFSPDGRTGYLALKTLQTIAGHSDINTTMNRYAHGRQDKIIQPYGLLKDTQGRRLPRNFFIHHR